MTIKLGDFVKTVDDTGAVCRGDVMMVSTDEPLDADRYLVCFPAGRATINDYDARVWLPASRLMKLPKRLHPLARSAGGVER
jgi:hypothetical protein